ELGRTAHVKRLVRPLVVVAGDEVIELGLLLKEVFAGGLGGLELQGQMHAFVAPILLRVAGLDALDLDAEAEPPDRELGEIEQGVGTGEWDAVVGADGLGQAELLEGGLEHLERIGFLGAGERLASDQVAAGEVGDGQRIAIAAVSEHELALVVGAPQIIGLSGMGKGGSVGSVASSASTLDQSVAVEHGM